MATRTTDIPPRAGSDALAERASRQQELDRYNKLFAARSAEGRVAWALEHLPRQHVLTSSFGVQAAVSLHLITKHTPDIPVIFIDTGYLFPETYRFVDELTERLELNLKVYRSEASPAWQETRDGRRWEQGAQGLEAYNRENKVEPMERALHEIGVGTWFAGLRRDQTPGRSNVPYMETAGDRWKVHPIADWTDRDVYRYLQGNRLPYHPLWKKGYISIGDVHTTRSLHEVEHVDQTRFFGLKRECGLHEIDLSAV